MKTRYIICLLLLGTIFSGCKKYLDVKSDDKLLIPSTLSDLQSLLDNEDIMNFNGSNFGEGSADDYFLTDDMYNAFGAQFSRQVYTWRPNDMGFGSDWSTSYSTIYTCNVILERLAKIQRTSTNQSQWDNIKGSALFSRGFTFLNLTWCYARAYDSSTSGTDMGIILRVSSDPSILSVRANVSDCYKQILADVSSAAQILPINPQHVERPSKAAAYAVLARAYLSMRDYDNALENADRALAIRNTLMDYNDPAKVDVTSGSPIKRFNDETVYYSEMGLYSENTFPLAVLVDTNLYKSYADDDIRKVAFFSIVEDNKTQFKGSYAEGESFKLFNGIATDELYLISSECNARKNNITEALNKLNALLRTRWVTGTFVPITSTNKDLVLQKILLERRKELLNRGLRWPEIKRLNKEGANIIPKRVIAGETYTLKPNEDRYALPLPNDIIKVTGLPQNPGW